MKEKLNDHTTLVVETLDNQALTERNEEMKTDETKGTCCPKPIAIAHLQSSLNNREIATTHYGCACLLEKYGATDTDGYYNVPQVVEQHDELKRQGNEKEFLYIATARQVVIDRNYREREESRRPLMYRYPTEFFPFVGYLELRMDGYAVCSNLNATRIPSFALRFSISPELTKNQLDELTTQVEPLLNDIHREYLIVKRNGSPEGGLSSKALATCEEVQAICDAMEPEPWDEDVDGDKNQSVHCFRTIDLEGMKTEWFKAIMQQRIDSNTELHREFHPTYYGDWTLLFVPHSISLEDWMRYHISDNELTLQEFRGQVSNGYDDERGLVMLKLAMAICFKNWTGNAMDDRYGKTLPDLVLFRMQDFFTSYTDAHYLFDEAVVLSEIQQMNSQDLYSIFFEMGFRPDFDGGLTCSERQVWHDFVAEYCGEYAWTRKFPKGLCTQPMDVDEDLLEKEVSSQTKLVLGECMRGKGFSFEAFHEGNIHGLVQFCVEDYFNLSCDAYLYDESLVVSEIQRLKEKELSELLDEMGFRMKPLEKTFSIDRDLWYAYMTKYEEN